MDKRDVRDYIYLYLKTIIYFSSARPSKLRAKMIIAGIWLISGLLAAPMAAALRVILIPEYIAGNKIILLI